MKRLLVLSQSQLIILLCAVISVVCIHRTAYAAQNSNIAIAVDKPIKDALIAENLKVIARVTSTYDLQSVVASVEDRQTPMALCTTPKICTGWTGDISLAGLERGEKTLLIKATDVFGSVKSVKVKIFYDQTPQLIVSSPQNGMVARPMLHITAACTDDDPSAGGCVSIKASVNGRTLVSRRTNIDESISFSAYEGKIVSLKIVATDSSNKSVSTTHTIYVESSTKLSEVASVNGRIFDVTPDRILFLDNRDGRNDLMIRYRSSGQEEMVMNEGSSILYAFLTPKGAIFLKKLDFWVRNVYEWREHSLLDLGRATSDISLKVKGHYAVWSQPLHYSNLLFLRNLLTGTNESITTSAAVDKFDVGINGDVVYWAFDGHGNIYRHRNGVRVNLTNNSNGVKDSPRTDGINVVYTVKLPAAQASSSPTHSIVMYSESGEVTLASGLRYKPVPVKDYLLRNGWVAFRRPSASGIIQVWTRSPSGEERQVSFFGTSSSIRGLDNNGGVTFSTGNNRLYLARPNLPVVDISTNLGKSFSQNGEWFLTIGRSVFRLNDLDIFNITFPATITLAGDAPVRFDHGHSSAMDYSGFDNAGVDLTRPAFAVSGAANEATVDILIASKNPNVSPSGGAIQLNDTNTPQFLKSADNARAFLAKAKALAQSMGRYYTAPQPGNMGSSGAPAFTFIDNRGGAAVDFGPGLNGVGLLIVTGELNTRGNSDFQGVILALGEGSVNRNGGGGGIFLGSMVIANFEAVGSGEFGSAAFNFDGGGNSNMQYDSAAVANALATVGLREVTADEN